MNFIKKSCAAVMLALTASQAFAGGMLTNTNQSIAFLRNPARDAAIGIDGTYSNPAGVAFLGQGFHIGFHAQTVWQTRQITTTNPLFALGEKNNGNTAKTYEGKARAPFLPALGAAYNTGKWSFQFNAGVIGGGGKCEFANGLGSFEGAVGMIASQLNALTAINPSLAVSGYDMNSYMQGRQYYYGVTLGAAYKVNEHLSVYGGVRALIGDATYKAKLANIQVKTEQGMVNFGNTYNNGQIEKLGYLGIADAACVAKLEYIENNLTAVNAGLKQFEAFGGNIPESMQAQYQTLVATKQQLEAGKAQVTGARQTVQSLDAYGEGVNLQSDQSGFGIAPIIGIDYKIGAFNFAAKYEFRTKMSMKNKSTLSEASDKIYALNQFVDGSSVREDSPAMLALGAQWSVLPNVRVNAGYHYFYDKQSTKDAFNDKGEKINKQDLLSHGTIEWLAGAEWDICDKLTVSAGGQITNYGLTDEYMSDMSFVVNSYSLGCGVKYTVNEKVAINAAYFTTKYGDYNSADAATQVKNTFTRTNRVLGVGVELNF